MGYAMKSPGSGSCTTKNLLPENIRKGVTITVTQSGGNEIRCTGTFAPSGLCLMGPGTVSKTLPAGQYSCIGMSTTMSNDVGGSPSVAFAVDGAVRYRVATDRQNAESGGTGYQVKADTYTLTLSKPSAVQITITGGNYRPYAAAAVVPL